MSDLRLLRLLQLASPALPVGAFSYSQGLEAAIEAGLIGDAAGTARWIDDCLACSIEVLEAPVLSRLHQAWCAADEPRFVQWNDYFLASRETAELRAETVQMGYSLTRLLPALDIDCALLARMDEVAYPSAFACASAAWDIGVNETIAAYLWSWAENQVMAAVKAVPLGQTEAQRLLAAIAATIPARTERITALADEELASFSPGLAILSSRHETQYTRLFRS